MTAFCLAMHQHYRCRHTGVCCTSDWLVPAELHVLEIVERFGIRRSQHNFTVGAPDEEPWVARQPDGTCVFFDREDQLCSIHRDAGEQALPTACRHFPREILQDGRGTFISLSHYCPTAAGLLAQRDAIRSVEAMPPLRLDGELEALDARDALPPLLRPGLLTDLEGYDAWERESLALLARDGVTSREALRLIAGATEEARQWTPGAELLAVRVEAAFKRARPVAPVVDDLYAPLMAQHPPERSWPVANREEIWRRLVEPALAPVDYMIKNYLASRLFGNWIAYQGRGLRSIVAWLCTCDAVLRNEIARRCAASGGRATADDVTAAAGAADLLLIHTIDSAKLGKDFEGLEGG